ncbi:MAG: hypothetical protein HY360_10815 [Verrucomicrobia bacterium]|nr:hypothetical protein [Verrucomicrobiota bacterium]
MKSRQRFLLSFVAVMVSSQWLCVETQAIPPFARKYRTSCNTCHVIIPKLNSFGEAYRLNGYKIADSEETMVKEDPVVLGAPGWKQVFPDAMWPSQIPGLPSIGFRFISDLQWTESETGTSDASRGSRLNFEFPYEFEMLMGGRFDKRFGYFGEVEWQQGSGAIVNQGYLVANDFIPAVPERALSGRVGLMDLQLLSSYNNVTRAGKNHPLWGNKKISDWRLLRGGTVVRSDNNFRLQDTQPAIEVNGILARRLYWGAGAATGNGPNRYDVDTPKDGYYKLKWKPFGRDFLGSVSSGDELSMTTKPSGGWVDNGLLLEHFGYFGDWPAGSTPDAGAPGTTLTPTDDFRYLGVAVRGTWQNLDLAGGYINGYHARPWGKNVGRDLDMNSQDLTIHTWFVKAEYMFFPWLMGRAVYEQTDAEEPPSSLFGTVGPSNFAAVGNNGSLDQSRILFGPVFSLRANIRVALEIEKYIEHEGSRLVSRNAPDSYWLRLDYAF